MVHNVSTFSLFDAACVPRRHAPFTCRLFARSQRQDHMSYSTRQKYTGNGSSMLARGATGQPVNFHSFKVRAPAVRSRSH